MKDAKHLVGTVTSFDTHSGVARVELQGMKHTAELHAAAFISGRPARLPSVGESVQVQVAGGVVIVARPVHGRARSGKGR